MPTLLTHPAPARRAALLALALAAANTLYCQAYNTLAGRPEALSVSLIWFAVNVLPWFVAFEGCKRLAPGLPPGRAGLARMAGVLLAAALASLLLGWALAEGPFAWGFQAVRRIPTAGLVVILLLARALALRQARAKAAPPPGRPSLGDPREIDWLRSASNYVEVCRRGRAELVRMTLRAAAEALPERDFIRVHRTLLVRRDRIAAHRRGKEHDEVHLSDGSVQRVGESYRAQVARLFADAA